MGRALRMYCFVWAFVVTFGRGEAFSQSDFWQKTNPPFGRTVSSVASNSSSTIIAGTDSGVFRSTDNGGTWTGSNSGLNPVGGYFVFSSGATIIASGTGSPNSPSFGGYYRTSDNGSHWTQFVDAGGFRFRHAVAINDSGYIFGGWGVEAAGGVERSTDNGASWTNTGLIANSYALAITANGTIFSGGVDSHGACVYRSTDNGSSWTNTEFFTFFYPVNVLAISPSGHIFAGTSTDGVMHSTDNGAQWIYGNTGMWHSFVTRLAINAFGQIFAGTLNEGVFRSTDDGYSWTSVNAGLTNDTISSMTINPGGTIFVVTQDGLFRSVQSTTVIPTAGLQLWLKADAGVDTTNGIVSSWHDQSGKGNDAVQTSASRQPVLVAGALNGKPIIRFDGVTNKLGFTGTSHMTQFSIFMVINNHPVSTNPDGVSPVLTLGANGDYNHQWFMLLRYQNNSQNIALGPGTESYIEATSSGLAAYDQWRNLSIVTTGSVFSTTLRRDGAAANISYMGTDESLSVPLGDGTGSGGGIGGADGVPAGTLAAKCDVAEVIVYNVALSDSARGAVESYLATKYGLPNTLSAISEQRGGSQPQRYVLEQNYPNPFNPTTTIRYSLPQKANVSLIIYNTLGQRIAELVNGDIEAGYHEVQFDGRNLASGVYFYRLTAGSFVETRKLLLVR